MSFTTPGKTIGEAYNFRDAGGRLLTSGQPTEVQLASAAGTGVRAVINLALHDDPRYSLKDEAGCVQGLSMDYTHIPVPFAAPRESDLLAFLDAMDAHRDQKVLVHCAANFRASVFVGLWRVLRQGWTEEDAFALARSVWAPDAVWTAFIANMLSKHRDKPQGTLQ